MPKKKEAVPGVRAPENGIQNGAGNNVISTYFFYHYYITFFRSEQAPGVI